MHEGDRERANSIILNMVYRPSIKIRGRYKVFFDKKRIKEEQKQLNMGKLFELGQLTEGQYETTKETHFEYAIKLFQ